MLYLFYGSAFHLNDMTGINCHYSLISEMEDILGSSTILCLVVQSLKKCTEYWISSVSWKSGAGWNNVLHIKHNWQIHCPSVSADVQKRVSICFPCMHSLHTLLLFISRSPFFQHWVLGYLFSACSNSTIYIWKKNQSSSIRASAIDPLHCVRRSSCCSNHLLEENGTMDRCIGGLATVGNSVCLNKEP